MSVRAVSTRALGRRGEGAYGGADGDEGELALADVRYCALQAHTRAKQWLCLLHALGDVVRDVAEHLLALPEALFVLSAPCPAHVPWRENDEERDMLEALRGACRQGGE